MKSRKKYLFLVQKFKQKYVILNRYFSDSDMQRELVIKQLKETIEKTEGHLLNFRQQEQFTYPEAEQFLQDMEKLVRDLAVYTYLLKQQELSSDLKVHLKIMQHANSVKNTAEIMEQETQPETAMEPEVVLSNISIPKTETLENQVSESEFPQDSVNLNLKKIEFTINDKFRVINELFFQNNQEFQAAMQQINSIGNLEESLFYLDSLKQIYTWKDDQVLVKSLYAMVHKRFS